ncbi:hypothetical protein [Hymenobacter cellulosivorans]|uniref:Uncharacterized protein n=1 Tax=Hymenobacter cellulosivorans TaxID=2932249 RepID=A0ABY4F9R1_9BACT|nr:hypothetical protein [Hymenobacter cellulosivorans]UOQ52773.1 hypothetical protein MUN80_23900 [Hymenobacter cellulosivorans]
MAAKVSLEAQLDSYSNRDQNLAFQDRQEDRADASVAARLTTAINQVTYLTDQLARPDLSDADRSRYQDQLITATYQKTRLQNRSADTGGTAEFLADAKSDQVDIQVGFLTKVIEDVQAHHDTLSA